MLCFDFAEKQVQSTWEIWDLIEKGLDHAQKSDSVPMVHWALDMPNGEETQGHGESSDESKRQFETNEDF